MIEVKDLYYEYEDGTRALENINIDGSKGRVVGIIGANGSGKSTLFLNIMGILRPRSGSIYYDGSKLKYSKKFIRDYRKDVNIVFQNPDQQLFYSDVYDDIAFALRNLGVSEEEIKDRAVKALEEVGCLDLIDKPIHFLSYGQKKRISIAGILALNGRVILMDEPTSGLDPEMTREMKGVIERISRDRNIFISSHDMDLIYEICDYIYVINKGRITCSGSPEEVFTRTDILEDAKLNKPWLVKIHEKLGLPLFESEEEFLNYNK